MPQILVREAPQAPWAASRERGAFILMRLTFLGLRWFRRPVMVPIVRVTTLYFFIFGRRAREASFDYLRRLSDVLPEAGLRPTRRDAWRHFKSFEGAILDKIDVWMGRLKREEVIFSTGGTDLGSIAKSGRGILIIGSHLGNLEICRAFASAGGRTKLNVLVHTAHADYFNRILAQAGASQVELIQVGKLDVRAALSLKTRIDRGEWVVITGDRTPVSSMRTVDVDFLGGKAALPIGPYVLGALLDCPVHLLFCLRRASRHHIYIEPFAERMTLPRRDRDAAFATLAQRFAARLEHYLRLEPLQWFNFYPFWRS